MAKLEAKDECGMNIEYGSNKNVTLNINFSKKEIDALNLVRDTLGEFVDFIQSEKVREVGNINCDINFTFEDLDSFYDDIDAFCDFANQSEGFYGELEA